MRASRPSVAGLHETATTLARAMRDRLRLRPGAGSRRIEDDRAETVELAGGKRIGEEIAAERRHRLEAARLARRLFQCLQQRRVALDRRHRRPPRQAQREGAEPREQVGDRRRIADMGGDRIGERLFGVGRGLHEAAGRGQQRGAAGGDLRTAVHEDFGAVHRQPGDRLLAGELAEVPRAPRSSLPPPSMAMSSPLPARTVTRA